MFTAFGFSRIYRVKLEDSFFWINVIVIDRSIFKVYALFRISEDRYLSLIYTRLSRKEYIYGFDFSYFWIDRRAETRAISDFAATERRNWWSIDYIFSQEDYHGYHFCKIFWFRQNTKSYNAVWCVKRNIVQSLLWIWNCWDTELIYRLIRLWSFFTTRDFVFWIDIIKFQRSCLIYIISSFFKTDSLNLLSVINWGYFF